MNQLKILNPNEKKEIEKKLNEQFGIKNVPGLIIQKGVERLFLFSGDLNKKELQKLEQIVLIERAGSYFAKLVDGAVKLSIEGVHALKDQIKKNIFEIPEDEVGNWMRGSELLIKTGKYGFLIMKHSDDFLGSGKASAEKITNFIPKSRRLKNRENEPIKWINPKMKFNPGRQKFEPEL